MTKKHLKVLPAPKTWPIKRRIAKFVTRPLSGSHKLEFCMPIDFIFKNILQYATTTRETRKILNSKVILVNRKRRKDVRFPVGLFDTLSIEEIGAYFRIILNKKGKLEIIPIPKEEADIRPCKIIGKTILKAGKLQLNLDNGRNMIVDKDDYKVGDVLIKSFENKIMKHLKLQKKVLVYFTGGKHVGEIGVIDDIKKDKVIYKNTEGDVTETLKEYAFVIGDAQPEIRLAKDKQ